MNESKRPKKNVLAKTQGPAGKGKKSRKREGKSIRWMVIALMIAVAFLAWVVAAASYVSDVEGFSHESMPVGRGRGAALRGGISLFVVGLARVLWNSIAQIPNVHRVVWHTMTQHPFILIVTIVIASGVALFGWWMARLEREFEKQDRKFRQISDT